MESEPVCQVCFNQPAIKPPNNPLLKCSKCHLPAHKYCYAPNSTTDHFLCDLCREDVNIVCKWCQNPGLLKHAGKHYGHPVCLLFNASAIVDNFSTLSFSEVETNTHFAKLKCSYCKNTTSSVLRCCLQCNKQTHIYCALQHSRPEDGVGWKLTLQPLNDFRNFFGPYENLILRALRTRSPFLASQLGVKKAMKTVEVGINLYCEQHSLTLVECVCREFDESKQSWIYCDGCCRWQHAECLAHDPKVKEILDGQNKQPYLCIECREWREWLDHPRQKIPERLPKMHIYDYVAFHCLLQEYKQESPQNWADFLITVPLLPGIIYAELFFRKELARKLKHKIDFPFLKAKTEEFQIKKQYQGLNRFYQNHKDKVELVWLLTEGTLFGQQERHFQHNVDQMDPDFIDQILDAIIHYEEMYVPKRPLCNPNNRKNMNSSQMKIKEEQGSDVQTHEKEGDINSSLFSKSSKKKSEKEEKIIKSAIDREKVANILSAALETLISKFKQSNFSDLENLYSKLHEMLAQPGARGLLEELPKNLFTNSVLQFQKTEESVVFMQFVAHINHLQHEWEELQGQGGGSLTSKQFEQAEQLNIMASCLKEQIYQLNHDQMQCLLLTEIHQRESEGKFPTLSVFQQCFGYQPQTWTVIPEDMLNLKGIKSLIKVKDLNLQKPPRLYLASSILEQLSTIQFQEQVYLKVKEMSQQLKQSYPELAGLLLDFMKVYEVTLKFLIELGVDVKFNSCLFQRLSTVDISQVRKETKKQALVFLGELGRLKLAHYSLAIQTIIKNFVTAFLLGYQHSEDSIQTEVELKLIKNWLWRLNTPFPHLFSVIKHDEELCNRFVFVEPRFELPEVIERIQLELKKALEEVEDDHLSFRIKKMELILQWIKTYKIILQKLPLQYILTQEKLELLNLKHKPQLSVVSQFLNIMNKMYFPSGIFKDKLEDIVNRGKALKELYEQIMSGCQWNFNYEKHEAKWEKKIPLSDLEKFIKEAQLIPLNFQVQILESQIIVQKFQEAEMMSGLLLAEAAQKSLKENALQRANQILNHLGATPLRSQYTERVIQLMDQLLGRSRLEVEVQQLYLKVQQQQPLPYESVIEVLGWLQEGKVTQKLNVELLKDAIAPLNECFSLYKPQIQQFRSSESLFTDLQKVKIRQLTQQMSKTFIFDFTLSDMGQEMSKYDFLMLCLKQIQHGRQLTSEQIKRVLSTIASLHQCFQDKRVQALRSKLQEKLEKIKEKQMK